MQLSKVNVLGESHRGWMRLRMVRTAPGKLTLHGCIKFERHMHVGWHFRAWDSLYLRTVEEQHSERQEEKKPVAEKVRFEDLDLHPDIEDGLWSMGFETATPIQGQAIPHAIKGKDILGIAQTGTGKTAAFLLPTMDRIMDTPNDGKVKALIVVPTRELAIQIDQAAQGFAYYTGITSLAIYGGGTGKEFAQEKKALTEGCGHHHCHAWSHAVSFDVGLR